MFRVAQLLYLMLPVYLANMTPPFVKYWRGWNRPICERLLGSHKTVIGFASGVLAAVVTAFLQSRIGWSGSLVDYDRWLGLGLACGVGALIGDALKSLIKRRCGIAPGERWVPADQLDFVVGGLVALSPFVSLGVLDVAIIVTVSFLGDLAVNQVSFRLGIRDTAW